MQPAIDIRLGRRILLVALPVWEDTLDYTVGRYYWVIKKRSPDQKEIWEYDEQPALYAGRDEHGNNLWCFMDFKNPVVTPEGLFVGEDFEPGPVYKPIVDIVDE